MEKGFVCQTGYHISPVAGGTYECSAMIERENRILFVRCRDNPSKTDSYMLNIVLGNESRVMGIERYNNTNFTNITSEDYISIKDSSIEVPAKMMEEVSFKIKQFPISLKIYLPENRKCIACLFQR